MNFLCYLLADSAQREREQTYGTLEFGLRSTCLGLHDKRQKQERKQKGGENYALSIVRGVQGHLGMGVHMQDTQVYIEQIIT